MPSKKKDPTDTNLFDELIWGLAESLPDRKDRSPAEIPDEDEEYLKKLEDKKRARREALKKKYEDD